MTPPRRVLMTADAVGGVWTHALELARGLAEVGTEVMLIVIGPEPSADQRDEAIAIPGLVLLVPKLALEWQDRAGPLGEGARRRLLGLEEAFRADLVHCNGFREAAAGFRAPVVVAAHSCVRTWWKACRREGLPADWTDYEQGVKEGLSAAAALVAPTSAFLAEFQSAWGQMLLSRMVPNGVDDLDPPVPPRRRPVILAAGRLWDEAKNAAALVRVARELPWPVLMAGDAPTGGLADSVRCLGRLGRPELHRLMSEAAIFVAPARYEPFGLAALEAAHAGCALVLGNLPSLVEVWGDAARFVPPDDAQALRRTLLDLVENQDALLGLQQAARQRARVFSRRRMVEGHLALYATVLGGDAPREEHAA